MFDIGFSELLLFGVIALIILGPEKLPQAARTAGQWYGKLRRTVSTLQSEIEAELDLAETRQQMQEELAKIRRTEAEMKREMEEMRGSIKEFESSQNESLRASQEVPTAHHTKDELAYASRPDLSKNPDYSYHNNQEIEDDDDFDEFSEGYICTDEDDTFYTSPDANTTDSSTEAATINNNSIAPVLTKPWQNMWFRLGEYDKARRLPPPPFMPNYKADLLLYDDAAQSNISQVDLDAKMPPIEEDELVDLDYEALDNLTVDNSSLATFSTDTNYLNTANKPSQPSYSLNKNKEDE